MKSVKISSKNQVVIPSEVRAKLGLSEGDRLIIERLTENEVTLRKEPSYRDLKGVLPKNEHDAVSRVRALRNNWR
jgi:AbrB family looped-hinge helix DNA binding protein